MNMNLFVKLSFRKRTTGYLILKTGIRVNNLFVRQIKPHDAKLGYIEMMFKTEKYQIP
jgi:hypothetical protein